MPLRPQLSPQIEALGDSDTLHLQITEAESPGAVFSKLVLSGEKRDRNWVHFLLRNYDSPVARFPGQSVLIGGLNARCTLVDVARGDAVDIARLLIFWWEEQCAGEQEPWTLSGASLEIGGGQDDPGISYTVDPTPPEDMNEPTETDVGSAAALPAEDQRQQVRRAADAWTEGLDDLAAATRLTIRPGHALEFGFRTPNFEPRLAVVERDTGVWNEKEPAAVAAEIRLGNPASGVSV